MDFDGLLERFTTAVTKILDSGNIITDKHIENILKQLKQLAAVEIENDKVDTFLNDSLIFFVFLNNYAMQFNSVGVSQYYAIRRAFGVFTFVVDTTKICDKIIKKFYKIIDNAITSEPENQNIGEFLRIYSHFLNIITVDKRRELANKHKSFPQLLELLKKTCDIETQAIIVEVVFKFLKCSDSANLNTTFVDMINIAADVLNTNSHIYQQIRMVLDWLNENSTTIMSVNCNMIELDSHRVVEYEGSSEMQDIWLDINLVQNKMSFFCDRSFAPKINKIKFYTISSSWEVVSFHTQNILKKSFRYDKRTENLSITLILKTSSLSLFSDPDYDLMCILEISISKHSNQFYKLIEIALPQLFGNDFSAMTLGIPSEQEIVSSSNTEVSIVEANDDSSPVIEYFQMRKTSTPVHNPKRISTKVNISPVVLSDESVISLSDGEDVINVSPTALDSRTQTFTELNHSKTGHTSEENNVEIEAAQTEKVKIVKASTCKKNLFNKSISPISFSEAVFNSRKLDKKYENRKKISTSERRHKISTIEAREIADEKIEHVVINKKKKISSAILLSPVLYCKKEANLRTHSNRRKGKRSQDLIENEERVLVAVGDDELDVGQDFDTSRVQDWLKDVDQTAIPEDEVPEKNADVLNMPESKDIREPVIDNLMEREDAVCVPSVDENTDLLGTPEKATQLECFPTLTSASTHNSERSSLLPPEVRIEKLMKECVVFVERIDFESEDNENAGENQNLTLQSLLEILEDQVVDDNQNVASTNVENNVTSEGNFILPGKLSPQKENTSEEFASTDEDVPLSQLINKHIKEKSKEIRNDKDINKEEIKKQKRQEPEKVLEESSYNDKNIVSRSCLKEKFKKIENINQKDKDTNKREQNKKFKQIQEWFSQSDNTLNGSNNSYLGEKSKEIGSINKNNEDINRPKIQEQKGKKSKKIPEESSQNDKNIPNSCLKEKSKGIKNDTDINRQNMEEQKRKNSKKGVEESSQNGKNTENILTPYLEEKPIEILNINRNEINRQNTEKDKKKNTKKILEESSDFNSSVGQSHLEEKSKKIKDINQNNKGKLQKQERKKSKKIEKSSLNNKNTKNISNDSDSEKINKYIDIDEMEPNNHTKDVIDNKNNHSIVSGTTDNSFKKIKRKLYIPGDLSCLNASLTEYLQSEKTNVTADSIIQSRFSNICKSAEQKQQKIVRFKEKKICKPRQKKESKQNKFKQKKQDYLLPKMEDGAVSNVKNKSGTCKKVLDSLKERLHEHKIAQKIQKRRGKNKQIQSSSSSSDVPFSIAVRTKRKLGKLVDDSVITKRQKEDICMTDEDGIHENGKEHDKICIISDVVVQPPFKPSTTKSKTCSYRCCLEELVGIQSQAYLELIAHVEGCCPEQLKSEDCCAIIKILTECNNV